MKGNFINELREPTKVSPGTDSTGQNIQESPLTTVLIKYDLRVFLPMKLLKFPPADKILYFQTTSLWLPCSHSGVLVFFTLPKFGRAQENLEGDWVRPDLKLQESENPDQPRF